MAGIKQIRTIRVDTGEQDKWLIKALDSHLTGAQRAARQGVFYPSALGSPCDRYLYNCYFGLVKEEPLAPLTRRIFDCGDYLGYRYEKYFEQMGILLGTELPVKCDSPPISGRLDFLIKHDEFQTSIIELKSINQRGFLALKKPKDDHHQQLQLYLNLTSHEHGAILYENKDDQKIKAFSVQKDEEVWKFIRERCERIMSMTEQPIKCTGLRWCPCRREV